MIEKEHILAAEPAAVWAIIGDPGRVDWVPGVESCEFDGQVRRFSMAGAGGLAERIVLLDHDAMRIEYSVVESTPPLESHLAVIQLEAAEGGTRMRWTTEVSPSAVEPFIEAGMDGSLVQLEQVLAS